MKRFWLLMFVVLTIVFTGWFAEAQQWVPANQSTIAWNATTTDVEGNPLPQDSVVKYYIYLKEFGVEGDGEKVGETDVLQYTVTFPGEGKFIVGVRSVRLAEGEVVGESTINWSDVNGESTPEPFGFIIYGPPAEPVGLRIQ